jgi:hypothetical protein
MGPYFVDTLSVSYLFWIFIPRSHPCFLFDRFKSKTFLVASNIACFIFNQYSLTLCVCPFVWSFLSVCFYIGFECFFSSSKCIFSVLWCCCFVSRPLSVLHHNWRLSHILLSLYHQSVEIRLSADKQQELSLFWSPVTDMSAPQLHCCKLAPVFYIVL